MSQKLNPSFPLSLDKERVSERVIARNCIPPEDTMDWIELDMEGRWIHLRLH